MTHPVQPATIKLSAARRPRRLFLLLCVLALSFAVRGLTAEFMRVHLSDAGWFQTGTYSIFDNQARAILENRASPFWIDDPKLTQAAVYPPGYPLWLALVYSLSGERSAYSVQNVQWFLDALSVLLVVGIGVTAYGWRTGVIAGALAALSPLLALYGATPMADAPASWTVLGGAWMLLLAARRRSWKWALGAGLMVGVSCWLRANALLLLAVWALALLIALRGTAWRERLLFAGAVALGALLLIAPIMIRNAVAFRAFLPTGLGVGTNLWEGIGETERAAEFGAVYSDEKLIEQERAMMGLAADAPLGLYWPDGVARDRARTRRALNVISQHPLWYARVMLRRMWGSLNYAGEPSTFYGFAGINVTSRKCLPEVLQGGALALFVTILGMVQSVWRHLALLLIVAGLFVALRRDWPTSALLLATALYYLIVGSFMHMEIRYGLPMQALLIVFAAVAASAVFELIRDWRKRRGAGAPSEKLREAVERQT
jgi:4-amino-4-deoxy-L-arabinose transferase-like glycosyltransferase